MLKPIFLVYWGIWCLAPTPPSIRTIVSWASTTTGSKTRVYHPALEKLGHWSSLENCIGIADHCKYVGVRGFVAKISQRVSLVFLLETDATILPKMRLTMFLAAGTPLICIDPSHPPNCLCFLCPSLCQSFKWDPGFGAIGSRQHSYCVVGGMGIAF